MSQKTIKFCLTAVGDELSCEIEGGAKDLTNMLASVIEEDKDIEMVVTLALLAVKMSGEDKGEDMLATMMSSIRPKAQA